jgi:hypothetical protein
MIEFWIFSEFFKLVFSTSNPDIYWRCGFIRIVGMEFIDKILSMFKMFQWFPGVFFSRESFPMYQILDFASWFARISNFLNIVHWFSFDLYRWRRRGFLLIAILHGFVWRKVRLVEHRMDGGPRIREVEFIG